MKRSWHLWLLLAACGVPVAVEPAAEPAPVARVETPAVTPPAPAPAIAPSVVEAPVVAVTPTAITAKPSRPAKPSASWVVPADSRFQLAGFVDGDMQIFSAADGVVVAAGRTLARVDERGWLAPIEYALSGLEPGGPGEVWSVRTLGGPWPATWMVLQSTYSRSPTHLEVYRREGSVWRPQLRSKAVVSPYYANIVDRLGGPVIGLRANAVNVQAAYEEVLPPNVLRKIATLEAADPERLELLAAKPGPATQEIGAGLNGYTMDGAATGELFMLATRGDLQPVVQRWGTDAATARTGTIDGLPGMTECSHLTVRTADEAYLRCTAEDAKHSGKRRPVLMHFDGATWSPDPLPPRPSLSVVSVAPDGGLYIITDVVESETEEGEDDQTSELWRRPARGAAWEQLPIPGVRFSDRVDPEWHYSTGDEAFKLIPGDPVEATREWTVHLIDVIARAPDDIWVVGFTRMHRYDVGSNAVEVREVVLHSGPAQEPEPFIPGGNLYVELLDWRPAPAWRPGKDCGTEEAPTPAFIAVRTLPRDTPHNLPEPAFEALARDHAPALGVVDMFVEVYRRGRRTTGLLVRPKTRADADALLAALEAVAPGEPRPIECRQPRIRRSFSKTTGLPQEAPPR